MNPKGNINYLRRRINRFVSKLFIDNRSSDLDFNQSINQVKKILISRPNHRLGNNLLLTPLVKEVIDIFPNAEIHLFLMGNIGDLVFENYKEVTKIIKLPRKPFKNILPNFKSSLVVILRLQTSPLIILILQLQKNLWSYQLNENNKSNYY